jgi:hypothetical protein
MPGRVQTHGDQETFGHVGAAPRFCAKGLHIACWMQYCSLSQRLNWATVTDNSELLIKQGVACIHALQS